jgi:tRNA threonylcarbamoyladenosine modification (KEOPS) complex  Pcc1 subunit
VSLSAKTPLLLEPYDAPDRRALAWVDAMLHEVETDVQRREALARDRQQENLSLALTAQAALLVRLRARVHSRFRLLQRGNGAKVE